MDAVEIFYPPPTPLKINQKCSTVTCLQKSGEVIYKFAKFLMFILSGFSSPSSNAKGRISNPDRRRRWIKPALGVALAMGVLTAGQAQAFVVTVGGQDWDVTTFTGTYIANISNFATPANGGVMPWWNNSNQSLAISFATAVGSGLGFPHDGVVGPLFGYSTLHPEPNIVNFIAFAALPDLPPFTFDVSLEQQTVPITWAQATPVNDTPVPGPLPALGAAAAFGFSRKLRKRLKINKGSSATFTLI
jgi:hypothetical protein